MKALFVHKLLILVFTASALCPGYVSRTVAADVPAVAARPVPGVLTLEQALELALTNNPGVAAGEWRVDAARNRALQARLWSNPELEFGSEDIPVTSGKFRDSKNTVGVSQVVPWPGKKRLEGRVGAAGVRQVQADQMNRRLELVRDVKVAFYRSIGFERVVAVARELASVAESSAATARKRVQAGAAPDQELLRAEIQLDQALADEAGFRRDLAAARQELAALIGIPDLAEAPLAGDPGPAPADFSTINSGVLQNHAILAPFAAVRERSELEWKRARLEPYPDIRMGVDGGREGRDDNAIIQFRVSVPLPIFDRSKARIAEARANVRAAEAELTAAELRLRRDLAGLRHRFDTAAQQVAAYRDRIIPKADRALRLVRTGFDEGKFTFIDLLDTQRTTAEAHLAYQQRLLDLNIAHAELDTLISGASRFTSTASPTHSSHE